MSGVKRQSKLEGFFVKRPKTNEIVDDTMLPGSNSTYSCESSEPSPDDDSIDSFDIAIYLEKNKIYTDEEKYEWIKRIWVPPSNFRFPQISEGKKMRSFQRNWLVDNSWLCYSHKMKGGFCKPCVLFGKGEGGKNDVKLGKLVNEPLTKFKKATEIISNHSEKEYHKRNMAALQNFVQIFEGKSTDVITKMDSARVKLIEKNRKRLIPIIKTVMLCGLQNIPLRGHRDDGALLKENFSDDDESAQDGNFRALLKFRIDAGDKILIEHLETASKNATYISKTTQNEIIECCGEVVTSKIIESVKRAKYFTVIADETTDISISEQLTLCIRYFDPDTLNTREEFLKFIEVTDTTGENLANEIIKHIENLTLSIENCRGQAYDGGSNMCGKFKGVQALILKKQPLAFYYHCANHKLNLALSKACSVSGIRNAMGVISAVANFFRESAQRKNFLEEKLKSIVPDNHFHKLKGLCETRWVERHDAVLHFKEIVIFLPPVLEEISNCNIKCSSTAFSLLHSIKSADFVVALIILAKLLAITLPLARQLQDPQINLSEASKLINQVLNTLKDCREIEKNFHDAYTEALEIAEEMEIEFKTPRKTKKQLHRSNFPTPTIEDHFRVTLWIPFLDYLISEITDRFPEKDLKIINNLQQIIPKYFTESSIEKIKIVAEIYKKDLPYPSALEGELCIWKQICKEITDDTGSLIEAYKSAANLPNIKVLLQMLAIHPVTTSTAERSFSTLRRIKTYLRSTMTENRLNGLALMNINRNTLFTAEEVLEVFSRKFKRKLSLNFL